ncbi:MAG: RdgB/HAM1 family non-canonical purine NTP pyrophosphatase [Desulfarculus sp.]|nr:RdgB/HAM1 family non-canonical purine NTP pyrophosphatase [Desulfarculus sp.]
MRLVLASTNPGKRREIEALLNPLGIEVATAAELGFGEEIAETGATFAENAQLKACAVARALNLPALADDSGLTVQALGGAPGVFSARYAGGGGDAANNAKLLSEMAGLPLEKRGAAFVCVMLCCRPDGLMLVTQGRLEGRIALAADGEGGFGYDPVFELPDQGLTVARLSTGQKNAISHRGQALRDMVAQIGEFLREA